MSRGFRLTKGAYTKGERTCQLSEKATPAFVKRAGVAFEHDYVGRITVVDYPTSNPQPYIRKCTASCWGPCKLADSIRNLAPRRQGARQTRPSARGYRMRLIRLPHRYTPRMWNPSHYKYWRERYRLHLDWPTSAAGCFRHIRRRWPERESPGEEP